MELHQAHGKVDAFRWVRAEARAGVCRCAGGHSIAGAHFPRGYSSQEFFVAVLLCQRKRSNPDVHV